MAQKKTLGSRRLNMDRGTFEKDIAKLPPATQKRYRSAYNEFQRDKQKGNIEKYPAAVKQKLAIKAEPSHSGKQKRPGHIAPEEANYRYRYVLRVSALSGNQRYIYYMTITSKRARYLSAADLTKIADYIEQTRDTGGTIEWVQVVSVYDQTNGDRIEFS